MTSDKRVITVRLNPEDHQELVDQAHRHRMSMNSYCLQRLLPSPHQQRVVGWDPDAVDPDRFVSVSLDRVTYEANAVKVSLFVEVSNGNRHLVTYRFDPVGEPNVPQPGSIVCLDECVESPLLSEALYRELLARGYVIADFGTHLPPASHRAFLAERQKAQS